MSAVKALWKNGQVILQSPADWPEGSRLVVAEDAATDVNFMTEEQQSDDPQAVQQWIDELRTLPAVPLTAEQEADLVAWRQRVKDFNLAAVRRQMEQGMP